jgi:hypothetical protein
MNFLMNLSRNRLAIIDAGLASIMANFVCIIYYHNINLAFVT